MIYTQNKEKENSQEPTTNEGLEKEQIHGITIDSENYLQDMKRRKRIILV